MRYLPLLIMVLIPLPAFAESHPEYFGIENPLEYALFIDDNTYSIPYQVNAKIIAMDIDPETTSLLIGLENTKDSVFVIDLQHEMINAENNEFVILVNGYDVDYNIISDSDSSTFSFYVPEFTEEVEVIGTHVIPEFPLGVILAFVLLITIVTVFSRAKNFLRL